LISGASHAQDNHKELIVNQNPVSKSVATKEPKKVKKITDRSHPDYIRCRKEAIIGSLSKKRKVCMTNKQWALDSRDGNRRAKEIVTDNIKYGS